MGRARLASTTAFGQAIDKQILTPKEARLQMITDGLMTISMPEDVPEDELLQAQVKSPERPGSLGYPQVPSMGGYGEVKAVHKSATEDGFKVMLRKAFARISQPDNSIRVRKLVRLSAKNIYPQVSMATKQLSNAELDIWNSYVDGILFDNDEDNAPEVLKASIKKQIDEVMPMLIDEDWYNAEMTEDELAALLSVIFTEASRSTIQKMADDLYENGVISSPNLAPNEVFLLRNPETWDRIKGKSKSIIEKINDGSRYYIGLAVLSLVRRALSQPDIAAKIRDGVDIETILGDNGFMQRLSQAVLDELKSIADDRVETVSLYESGVIRNQAVLEMFKRSGLKTKRWNHFASDEPCEYCTENMRMGFVPLDTMYRGVFGEIETPPAHPHDTEHCEIVYNQEELHSLARDGKLSIWNGE
jgi:hypothetical protein